MKRTYVLLMCGVLMLSGCGRPVPRDENGNPIFNSVQIATVPLANCTVDAYYYTVTNNIENPGSSRFVNETPTAAQVESFAVTEPSYFFLVHSNRNVRCIVMLDEVGRTGPLRAKYLFTIIRDPRQRADRVLLPYTAPLTQHRSEELARGPWDANAAVLRAGEARLCAFNGSTNAVLAFSTILGDLDKLITSRRLYE
jgi:hypothetical protein